MVQLNIDCEGPITQNDNAFELCEELIPNGGAFFARVSKYDDFLADIEKRPGYKAGDTLKLVLPFLKAYGATNQGIEEFSEKTLVLLPGARKMLRSVLELCPAFIISTSYRPYLEALCKVTGFPLENVYCTEVDLDAYDLDEDEKRALQSLAQEIGEMPLLSWPEECLGRQDLDSTNLKTLERLDEIFWKIIPRMSIGRVMEEVNPVGGVEKAKGVMDSLTRTGKDMEEVLYVGDSITDVQAFEIARDGGGVALSFNGNSYAVKSAQYALLSYETTLIAAIVHLLHSHGMKAVEQIFHQSETDMLRGEALLNSLQEKGVPQFMLEVNFSEKKGLPALYKITPENQGKIILQSEQVRRLVRGVAVGKLG